MKIPSQFLFITIECKTLFFIQHWMWINSRGKFKFQDSFFCDTIFFVTLSAFMLPLRLHDDYLSRDEKRKQFVAISRESRIWNLWSESFTTFTTLTRAHWRTFNTLFILKIPFGYKIHEAFQYIFLSRSIIIVHNNNIEHKTQHKSRRNRLLENISIERASERVHQWENVKGYRFPSSSEPT